MAKANKKYQGLSPQARQKAFDERREHNHFTQGDTGFIPKGTGQNPYNIKRN